MILWLTFDRIASKEYMKIYYSIYTYRIIEFFYKEEKVIGVQLIFQRNQGIK